MFDKSDTIIFLFQQLKEKLSIAYLKLLNYVSPLYMAYSYEEAQGPQHKVLAYVLRETSFYLNSTVNTLRHEVTNHHIVFKNAFFIINLQKALIAVILVLKTQRCFDSLLRFPKETCCYINA